jgi:hypothetical protein
VTVHPFHPEQRLAPVLYLHQPEDQYTPPQVGWAVPDLY